MQVRRKIKSDAAAKKKLPYLLHTQNYRCLRCNCKVVRVALVQKYRKIIGPVDKCVRWISPCGIKMKNPIATVDHILPRWNGGTNDITNLQCLCSACNGAKHIEETWHFRTRFNGICRKCGENAPKNNTKCYDCRRKEPALVKIEKKPPVCRNKVFVADKEWTWKCLKDMVLITCNECFWAIRLDIVLDMSFEEIEHARKNKLMCGHVTSRTVVGYIERFLANNEE